MTPKYAKDQPAGFVNRIEKVAIVGAGGTLGKYMAAELVKTGKHTVTALTRPNSSSKLAAGVVAVKVDYDDEASLAAVLEGQQFLIITLAVSAPPGTQAKLIRAAAKAGVSYVMPNCYGPDPMNKALMEDALLGGDFFEARALVESLGVSSWVALSCGFWYEFSLAGSPDRYGLDLPGWRAVLFDDGEARVNTSTWAQCGRAAAALLSLKVLPRDEGDREPAVDRWANGVVYVSSFLVSQRDMLESVKRATGTADADWAVSRVPARERWQEGLASMRGGDRSGFSRAMYTRIFFPGGEGDVEHRYGLANEALGLPREDLDECTREAVRMGLAGELAYN